MKLTHSSHHHTVHAMRISRISLFLLVFAAFLVTEAAAQSRFQLRRTKKESVPVNATLYAGYNGMTEPTDIMQDMFDHTNETSWGGVLIGLQGMYRLDTSFVPIWAGLDVYYNRIGKRWTMDKESVRFPDEPGLVDAVERVHGYGVNAVLGIGPVARIQLLLGGGIQYLTAQLDPALDVLGLFEAQIVPTVLVGGNVQLLVYDHGSIDYTARVLKGFGDYGATQFQSTLGFTFSF